MKSHEVKLGMNVVVNKLPDTTIYKVKEIDGRGVRLVYKTEKGKEVGSGNWVDCSILMRPTVKQLENSF